MSILLEGCLLLMLGVAAWLGLVLVISVLRLRQLQWQAVRVAAVDRVEIPDAHRQAMDSVAAELEQLGFIYRYSAFANKAVISPVDELVYFDVYQHSSGHSYVLVSLSPEPNAYDTCMLQFGSHFSDGSNWLTLNRCRHFSPMRIEGWQVFDDYLPHWQQAWQHHLKRVNAAKSPLCMDAEEARRRLLESFEALVPNMASRGDLVAISASPFFRLSWLAALRFTGIVLIGRWRAARVMSGMPIPAAANEEQAAAQRASADLKAFQEQLARRRSDSRSTQSKWLTFVVTAALFLLIGGWLFSWSVVPIVLVVIAIHEGGHYLAMRFAGYRNLSVFFLPGLGGLATGEKLDASPMEKLLVYLAGPVPGLLLAAVAFWFSDSGVWDGPVWLSQFLMICVFINYFNLLPMLPLDGGRVLEALVFTRLPRLRLAFTVIGGAALFGLGVMMDEPVLKLLAVLVALGLPHHFRLMQLDLALRRSNAGTTDNPDESQVVADIFTVLQAPRFQAWSFAKRMAAAAALLPEHLGRKPRILESVVGVGIYLCCLLAPIGVLAVAVPGLPNFIAFAPVLTVPADEVDAEPDEGPRAEVQDWDAQIANPAGLSQEQLLRAYLGAAEQANVAEDNELATRHYLKAWELAQALPSRDLRRIDVLKGLYSITESDAERERYARQILTELAQPQGLEREQVAWVKEQQAYAESNPALRVSLLQEAVALLGKQPDTSLSVTARDSLQNTLLSLAYAMDANQDSAAALAALQQRVDLIAQPDAGDRSRRGLNARVQRVLAQVELAWFLMSHERTAEAGVVAEQAAQSLPAKITTSWIYPSRQVREVLVWTQLLAPATADLAVYWRDYEAAQGDALVGNRMLLFHEVDRALVAQALKDAGLMAQAKAGVDEALAKLSARSRGVAEEAPPFCKPAPYSSGSANWRVAQQQARLQMLVELGVCASR